MLRKKYLRRLGQDGLTACAAWLSCAVPTLAAAASTSAAKEIYDPASAWDHLWNEVLIDISILGILFAAVTLYFIWRYRRRDPDQVGDPPKLNAANAVGWALIPAFIFMADDFFLAAKGWQLWRQYREVPAERMEVQIEAGMYSWDYTYDNGAQTQNVLRVPAGKPVMLRMTSRDTVHSHFIPDFRVKEDCMPGRVTYLWFYPKEAGKEHIHTLDDRCKRCRLSEVERL